jgi:hypothetical protein
VDYVRVYRDVSSGGLDNQKVEQKPILSSIVHKNLIIKFPEASKENQVAVFDLEGLKVSVQVVEKEDRDGDGRRRLTREPMAGASRCPKQEQAGQGKP